MGKAAVVEYKLPTERGKRDATRFHGPAGVLAMACLQGNQRKHGKPQRWRGVTANETPARDRLGRVG